MSGIKLVLRVPKECSAENATTENTSPSNAEIEDDIDGDEAENSNSCIVPEGNSASDENSLSNLISLGSVGDSSQSSNLKKKRKKRRFRFTIPTQKSLKLTTKNDDDTDKESSKKLSSFVITNSNSNAGTDSEHSGKTLTSSVKAAELTPLQMLLDYMLNYLEKKDPENYFTQSPSNDNITASTQQPCLDLISIRKKVEANEYSDLKSFKNDLEFIYNYVKMNNAPNTVKRVAAEKFNKVLEFLFSKEKLTYLYKTESYVSRIPAAQLGQDLSQPKFTCTPKNRDLMKRYACIVDDMCAEDVLAQATAAAEHARQKLSTRRPCCQTALINVKKDGTTTLKVVAPESSATDFSTIEQKKPKEKVFRLSDLVPKLKEGTPGILRHDSKTTDAVVPHAALDYGSYASFAPIFDSTWSTLSKEESNLLLSTFGNDQKSVDYVDSVRRFTLGTSDDLIMMVDGFLDALTNGEYTKKLKANNEEYKSDVLESVSEKPVASSQAARAVSSMATEPRTADQVLTQNCTLLSQMQKLQYERLSQPPAFVITEAKSAGPEELKLAQQCVSNLQALAAQATPADLVSAETVRNVMAVRTVDSIDANDTNGSEEYDMEVFKEFFEV